MKETSDSLISFAMMVIDRAMKYGKIIKLSATVKVLLLSSSLFIAHNIGGAILGVSFALPLSRNLDGIYSLLTNIGSCNSSVVTLLSFMLAPKTVGNLSHDGFTVLQEVPVL